jgi:hypothetical protein
LSVTLRRIGLMSGLRLGGEPLQVARAFVYVRQVGDSTAGRRVRKLREFAGGLGFQVLDVFVDEQDASDEASSPVFSELLDALWRNDGVLLVLEDPAQFSPDPVTQRSRRARVDATAAPVLYAQSRR